MGLVTMAKILIADDSSVATALLSRALAPLGHTIVVASDGEEAQKRLAEDHPDLLILDLVMPKVNGFQICRNVRADPDLRTLPIIVVTAMDRECDRYWGLKQGANEYLTKPFRPEAIQQIVRRYL